MTKIYGHRGFSGKYPENTMLAFEKAVEIGCNGIELDVQLTKDGECVIIHDETVNRTTNGTGYVKDYTLDEIKKLSANASFGDILPTQKIPTLREYFGYIKDKNITTNIEMKTSKFLYNGMIEKVCKLVEEFNLQDRIVYSSFNHYTCKELMEYDNSLKCGLLIDSWLLDVGEYAKKHNAYSVNAGYTFLTKEICDELHRNNILAMAWTPNETEDIKQLIENGCDVIITNYPDLAQTLIQHKRKK